MTRTSPLVLFATAAIAAALTWLLEGMLVSSGRAALVLPPTLGIALAVIGGILLLMAWPVRQAARGKRRVGFRQATSVLGFAKASSMVGALLGGAAFGALGFFVTRAVIATDAVVALVIVAVGALLELAAGLVAESWCELPPDEDDEATAAAGSAA